MLHGSKKLTVMAKGGKKAKEKASLSEGLWIAPRNSLKGPTGKRGWENRPGDPSSNNRFLELADIALGVKAPIPKKR
jgi:hypothetical protein